MRGKGINYDTGYINEFGVTTHEPWDPGTVARDLRVIRDELHCTAVRVTGGDPDRLETAARLAADLGLEVWFSPFTGELTTTELLAFLADCAERAEGLRLAGADVVLVTGAELSLFTVGFLPGRNGFERTAVLLDTPRERLGALLAQVPARINDFLADAVEVVRERFGGKIAYASVPFEGVDWTPFDFVAVDAYRAAEIADRYPAMVRGLVASGKPVAITEFGAATYRGAADRGARSAMMVEYENGHPTRLDGEYVRDEQEQAGYLRELLDIFEAEGVDTAFAFTYANFHLRDQFDVASYGLVKVSGGGTRERKAAFTVLAEHYR
ncbi:hypothetical protein FHS29_006749 [Saccharothrix tamanrassetensis]|uniref:Abortive infection protein n=1 Tax=Saccharothrix tamanrassetensis TaxID=1051531 RepID=A0A841CXQ2_9PSEU|nr:hypothetical protein [Saccharothrix tamanrassetensis]MBB5960126.1 hypothetical protein [Saccharothrix tamanrassetensis]